MLSWFLQLLGISDEITANLRDATFAFHRPTIFWIGAALLIPIAYFIYRRQQVNLVTAPAAVRGVLTACRIMVLAMLVVVLASPYVRIDHEIEKRPIVAVLVDHSQSMHLPAGPFQDSETSAVARAAGFATTTSPGGSDVVPPEIARAVNQMPRAELAHTAIEQAATSFTKPLAERFDLQMFGVGHELNPIAREEDGAMAEPPTPGGKSSPLGASIVEILDQAAGRAVAGIVLLSDGQNTGTVSLSQAALAAARAGTPVFVVPTGSATRLSDVAIVDVFTSGLVSVGDTASVSVNIESHGFDGRLVKVELLEGETTLAARDLTLRGAEQQQIELTFEAKEPGGRYLNVRITPLDEESIRDNNRDVAFLRADDTKIPVLYVEGLPRWDFRFLKNAMGRDHGLEPTVILEAESRGGSSSMPQTVDDWAKYRTVILGDCSTSLLDSASLESLSEAVRERGLGIVVLAGPNEMPHAYEGTALVDLLPVRTRRGVAGYDAPAYNPFRIEITPQGSVHDALRLYDDPGRNAGIWSNLPAYYWCAAVTRPAPAATVLATNPTIEDRFGEMPLIAYHHAGKGKVLFIGTDSTWLWRRNVGDRFFYKFWGQTIRFVARRDEKAGQKSWIEVRPLRAQPGEQAEIELMAYSPDGSARTDPQLDVSISAPDEPRVVTLDADSTVPGRYIGRFVPKVEGDYRIEFAPGESSPVTADIRAVFAAEELRRPNLDRPALELLASSSGGQLVELDQLGKIPPQLKGEPKLVRLHREESIWDNWFTLTLLVTIYCIDVGIRRLIGLS